MYIMKKILITWLGCMLTGIAFAQSMNDAVQQMNQNDLDNMQQQNSSNDNVNGSIGDALGHLNNFMGMARDAQDLYNSSR